MCVYRYDCVMHSFNQIFPGPWWGCDFAVPQRTTHLCRTPNQHHLTQYQHRTQGSLLLFASTFPFHYGYHVIGNTISSDTPTYVTHSHTHLFTFRCCGMAVHTWKWVCQAPIKAKLVAFVETSTTTARMIYGCPAEKSPNQNLVLATAGG